MIVNAISEAMRFLILNLTCLQKPFRFVFGHDTDCSRFDQEFVRN